MIPAARMKMNAILPDMQVGAMFHRLKLFLILIKCLMKYTLRRVNWDHRNVIGNCDILLCRNLVVEFHTVLLLPSKMIKSFTVSSVAPVCLAYSLPYKQNAAKGKYHALWNCKFPHIGLFKKGDWINVVFYFHCLIPLPLKVLQIRVKLNADTPISTRTAIQDWKWKGVK